jgi:amino acid adenylation domain-containing protein
MPTAAARVLHDLLDAAEARTPDRTAVLDRDVTWTYSRLAGRSRACAALLERLGVEPGARVVVCLANRAVVAALLFGASRAGAVLVPVDPGVPPHRLRAIAADAEPAVVITEPGVAVDVGGVVLPLDELERMLGDDDPDAGDVPRVEVAPSRVALLMYTSGSTSSPKGVVCPHDRVLFATRAIADRLGYREDDRVFVHVPLSFDYGLYQLFLACTASASAYLSSGGTVGVLRELAGSGSTVVPVVPPLAEVHGAQAERKPTATRVRLFTNTGATLGTPVANRLRANFPGASVVFMFGLTECKRVSISQPDEDLVRPGVVGTPLVGTTVHIADERGRELPPGRVGEIVVTGPHVMAGYHRDEELTATRFPRLPDGTQVLRTGDLGWLDEGGRLYFHGRDDDVFKRRGVRMSTTEIEAAACDVPGVRAAVAVPAGEELSLAVTGDLAPEAVLAELTLRLEPAKRPDRCVVVDALPLTVNGKVDRAAVTARLTERAVVES